MILTSLRSNQLSPEAYAWYKKYLAAFDTGDGDAFVACLAEDCVVQANDDLPLYGVDAVRSGMRLYMSAFESIEHEPLNIYGSDYHFGTELLCHYRRNGGGKAFTIPAATFLDRAENGLATSIRFYVNATPVWTPK